MNATTVHELMSSHVEALHVGETLDLAKMIMRLGQIRHLPVVDADENLIGLITHRDISSAWVGHSDPKHENIDEVASEIPVDMLMQTDVRTIPADMPALEAAELMQLHKYGCLPVVDGKRLVGIITETDFVRFAVRHLQAEAEMLAH